jgi:hypothetical protein
MVAGVSAEPCGDGAAQIAALHPKARVAKPLRHQSSPKLGDGAGAQGQVRRGGKADAGQAWDHQVETVLGVAAEVLRPGQRADHVGELIGRARPAMGENERARPAGRALDVEGVNREAVDFHQYLRPEIERGLVGAPVIGLGPVVEESGEPADVEPVFPIGVVPGRAHGLSARDHGDDPVELRLGRGDLVGLHGHGHGARSGKRPAPASTKSTTCFTIWPIRGHG